MIRKDIKQKLKGLDLNELFFEHRTIDLENYRVGKIDKEIIVWNPETNEFMDYFYDDSPDQIWFDLSKIDPTIVNYKINREGQVVGPRKTLSLLSSSSGYPEYKIKGRHIRVHVLLAKYFIPNIDPIENIIVDHIDRDRKNHKLENLRWHSIIGNANNMSRAKWTGKSLYRAYKDVDHKILAFKLNDEEFYEKYKEKSSLEKGRIRGSIKENIKRGGYYWEIEDIELTDYMKNIAKVNKLDENLWKLHYLGNFYVHPIGIIKNHRGIITVGSSKNDPGGTHQYRRYHKTSKGSLYIHRVVAEVFLNGNKPIDESSVVDHINTNPEDNRVENLRICTHSENMRNETTLKRLSREVVDKDGKVYKSITDCAKHYGVTIVNIWGRLNGLRPNKGFKYLNDDNDQ